jgi:uncharacterized protein YfiM (DUF2279 family)
VRHLEGKSRAFVAAAILGVSLFHGTPAVASESDPWLGPDKPKHFAATFVLASGGYAGASFFDERRGTRLLVGGSLAMGVGVAKELWDLSGHGDPSWRDLTWDAFGTAAGLLTSWLVDRVVTLWFAPAPVAARENRSVGFVFVF